MNSLPLRKLIRKYGALGYVVAGCYLLGYWLFRYKHRQTTAILALVALSAAGVLRLNLHASQGTDQTQKAAVMAMRPDAAHRSVPSYTLTDLGILPGYTMTMACGINATGQTAGNLINNEKNHSEWSAFICASDGKMSNISTLGNGDFFGHQALTIMGK